ncbi:p21-activated protein kinase-interacting protein 1-like [Glycine max]|nr:p21-activated protein kinase-interacting protein 1-like [Glycine max]
MYCQFKKKKKSIRFRFNFHPNLFVSVHRKHAINDLAIHPSGEVALTISQDKCFAVVDLMHGLVVDCRSFCRPLGKEESLSLVKFNAAGDRFFVAALEKVSVYVTKTERFLLEFECSKRVLCAASSRNALLYTDGEDRNITAWNIKSGKVAYCVRKKITRVKGIVVTTDSDGDEPYLMAFGSSDGIIRFWDVRMAAREKPLVECNTNSRLTCLAGSYHKLNMKQGNEIQRNKRKDWSQTKPIPQNHKECEIESKQATGKQWKLRKRNKRNWEPNLTRKTERKTGEINKKGSNLTPKKKRKIEEMKKKALGQATGKQRKLRKRIRRNWGNKGVSEKFCVQPCLFLKN